MSAEERSELEAMFESVSTMRDGVEWGGCLSFSVEMLIVCASVVFVCSRVFI